MVSSSLLKPLFKMKCIGKLKSTFLIVNGPQGSYTIFFYSHNDIKYTDLIGLIDIDNDVFLLDA